MNLLGKMGGGASGGMPRPVPRPSSFDMPGQERTAGGLFGSMSSQQRYDLARSMLEQGMAQASGSTSPLLQFLAPVVGAMGMGRLEAKHGAARDAEIAAMTGKLNGGQPLDPAMQGYADILNNENAPEYLRTLAKERLLETMRPSKAGGGGSAAPGRAPSNTDALLASMFYNAGLETSDGGVAITPAEQARIDAVTRARSRSSSVSYDYGAPSVGSESDPLMISPTPDNDPLGIR
jgi:hypothetical protein